MGDFTMPSLGADMDAGSVLEWCVRPGDPVHHGDVVAVIHTDKNDIDAEVFEDGVIGELLVEPGVEVAVGTPLATIVAAGTEPHPSEPHPSEPHPDEAGGASVAPTVQAPPGPTVPTASAARTFSPIVRRLVTEGHLDPAEMHGSGPGGSLTRTDVEAAMAGTAAQPPSPPRRISPRARRLAKELGIDPMTVAPRRGAVVHGDDVLVHTAPVPGEPRDVSAAPTPEVSASSAPPAEAGDRAEAMRGRIATLMERSNREIPHYHLMRRIDLTATLAWITRYNEDRPARERMIPAALLLAAVARAADEVPGFNGHWRDGTFQPAARVDLGLIVSLRDGGLLVPVIADAASLGAPEMMERVHGAVSRARKGRLRSSELGEGTITVSELGDGGADAVFGVIHPPQVALVGFGRPHDAPWVENGMIGVRTVVDATLAADHRVSDGHTGSRFLLALDTALQDPAALEGAPP